MNLVKTAFAGGALATVLFSSQAFAILATFEDWAGMTSADIGTVTDPDDFGGLTVTDKTITFISSGVGTSTQGSGIDGSTQTVNTDFVEAADEVEVNFTESSTTGRHLVTARSVSGDELNLSSVTAGNVLGYQYVINIDPSSYPAADGDQVFGSVFLGVIANGTFGSFTVSKRVQGLTPISETGGTPWSENSNFAVGAIFDDTLETTGATPDDVFCGVCTTFLVTDLITINSTPVGADLSAINNSFEQQTVPVPAPLALVGAGIIALGFARRRANKAA
jgi:hypothetical protein